MRLTQARTRTAHTSTVLSQTRQTALGESALQCADAGLISPLQRSRSSRDNTAKRQRRFKNSRGKCCAPVCCSIVDSARLMRTRCASSRAVVGLAYTSSRIDWPGSWLLPVTSKPQHASKPRNQTHSFHMLSLVMRCLARSSTDFLHARSPSAEAQGSCSH